MIEQERDQDEPTPGSQDLVVRRPDVAGSSPDGGVRICIIGGPRTGKTTLASTMSNVLHTDDLIGQMDWSAASEHVATGWMLRPGPWVIEGVATVRALRKWLESNKSGKPCEQVIVMREPKVDLSKGQSAMAKGHESIWREIEPLLRLRGVEVKHGS